ncbi:MAG: hypothetical protein AAFR12_19180 [Cyanobacteria bacterium J06626_6]
MKGLNFSALWASALRVPALRNGLRAIALSGLVTLSAPTAAAAQMSTADQDYLNSLYSFLQAQDTTAYGLATNEMRDEGNIWIAQTFCQSFERGASPADVYSVYMSAVMDAIGPGSGEAYEQATYAIGLYSGSVMNLGSAYYCPQYQPQVEQALRSL